MKKNYYLIGLGVVVVAAGIGYYFFWPTNEYGPQHTVDLSGIVQPVVFSMKNRTFIVPNDTASSTATSSQPTIAVTLDLLSPSAKRDYPMGRFTSADGVEKGTLVAQDNFTTPVIDGRQAVPIVVSGAGSGSLYYLAILETSDTGSTTKHINSLLIGDRIKIKTVTTDGTNVTVTYFEHARDQALATIPTVETTAIFDIAAGTMIQAGRKPWLETETIVKSFSGEYVWQKTTTADGTQLLPVVPGQYTLLFDGRTITLGTDCNVGGATFTVGSSSPDDFTVGTIVATKKFCTATQEIDYFAMIAKITTYKEATDGTLTVILSDGGVMTFVPKEHALQYENNQASTTASATTTAL